MKTYTTQINKLYETIGFEKIEKGKSYTTAKGDKVSINDIYIDATNENAETYIAYNIEKTDGTKLDETNKFDVVVNIIRSK